MVIKLIGGLIIGQLIEDIGWLKIEWLSCSLSTISLRKLWCDGSDV